MKKKLLLFSISSILLGSVFALTSNILNNEKVMANAVQYYKLGTRLEAEDYDFTNCTPILTNDSASSKVALDAGDGGFVTFNFELEQAGNYDLLIGYYTENEGAKIGLEINEALKTSHTITNVNGWCNNTDHSPVEHLVEVSLVEGTNTITVHSDNIGEAKYLNIDYIKLLESYNADGTRIQAENASSFNGGDGYFRTYVVPNVCDTKVVSIDDDISSKPTYKIIVPEDATYTLQIAYYSENDVNYQFNFEQENNNPVEVLLNKCPGGFPNVSTNYLPYTSKANVEVTLTKGVLYLSFQYISKGFADFDWFRLYKNETTLADKIQAEDFVKGDANVTKNTANYPILDGYAVELAQGEIEFNVTAPTASKYRLYIVGYTATTNAYLNLKLNGNDIKLTISSIYATGWTGDVTKRNAIPFEIELNEGVNNFVIRKGADDLAGNYVDIDYFRIVKNNILVPSIELDFDTKNEVIIDKSIIDYEYDYILSVSNTNVARIEGNVLFPVKGGETKLLITYEVDGALVTDEIHVSVLISVAPKEIQDQLKAFDTTRSYNGSLQYVDVSMPEGWSFVQHGATANVGTYIVKITFSHPNYVDVVRYPVVLTITKADYTGTDLYCDDATFEYDGETHSISASAPSGWTIIYSENSFKEIGEYNVTVTFTHESYNTVTKECKVYIVEPATSENVDNTLPIILGVVGGVLGAATLTVLAVILIKKYRSNHEVIK